MSRTYVQTANQIITAALRMVGALAKNQAPDNNEFNEGLDALNALLNDLAEEESGVWRMTWGSQKFTASSAVSNGGKYYRCIRSHTSASTNEPGSTTQPDWRSYWYEDSGVSGSTSAWVTATAYTCSGDFTFTTAHAISKAFLRYQDHDYPIKLAQFGEFLDKIEKYDEDIPTHIYFDRLNTYRIFLHPIPNSDVVSNGALHYQYTTFLSDLTNASNNISIPPAYIRALKFKLAADLAYEKGLETQRAIALKQEAEALWQKCRRGAYSDISESRGIKPCF